MKPIKGIIAYSVENGNHHSGRKFTTHRTTSKSWNSRRRFSA